MCELTLNPFNDTGCSRTSSSVCVPLYPSLSRLVINFSKNLKFDSFSRHTTNVCLRKVQCSLSMSLGLLCIFLINENHMFHFCSLSNSFRNSKNTTFRRWCVFARRATSETYWRMPESKFATSPTRMVLFRRQTSSTSGLKY
jgi:hypothetical protein